MNANTLCGTALLTLLNLAQVLAGDIDAKLELHTRFRRALLPSTNEFQVVERTVNWDPRKTAIIVCDMWDRHWCKGATARVEEMAPRMNRVLQEARARGVYIIHAPSDTMNFYKDWPQRKLAQAAPKATPPSDVTRWQSLNHGKEPPLPIDDTDGGCDDRPPCPSGGPWKRQIDILQVAEQDAITDSGEEVYNLLQANARDHVIVMGVHENMCVLGRPFSIRQLVTIGKDVVLMRDMTDTMYNSRSAPYVSHFVGTDLVAEHIEKYWCPTVTSADLLGGEPFHFQADRRHRVAMIVGENEYHTWETLPEFVQKELSWRGFTVDFVQAAPTGGNTFTNWEAITRADLLLVSVRRRTPPTAMLAAIRQHLEAGKPLIGLRTASHAFGAKPADADHAGWDAFDTEILGGKYEGHYDNQLLPDIRGLEESASHPVLTGISKAGFRSGHSLYRNRNLAATTQPLLTGIVTVDGQQKVEPVAWVNTNNHRRVFYTSLGGPEDFRQPAFRRLLVNATHWTLDVPVPPAPASVPTTAGKFEGGWYPLRVPGTWEENSAGELSRYDGMAWYRCVVRVPENWRDKKSEIWVERVDNAHEVYVNGVKVGGAGGMPPAYKNGDTAGSRYSVNSDQLVYGGDNLVCVRVYDDGGRGGFKGDAPALLTPDDAIKLEGNWQFRTGDDLAWAKLAPEEGADVPRFNQVIDATAISARTAEHQVQEQPLTPVESFARFQVADDLEIEQVLKEPVVRQPVFLNFDERGRMWVVQYLQYPDPAGLKLMSRDNVWRAVYDKIPPAPPHHFPGADKITIHEDTDGDGVFDRHKTFIDGLNIVSSVERGRGGVWVLNPPYLLFYRDANDDDIPDGDPEVRLSGFGLEDTHSVANSLRWGPDGWLYGCQGSTVTGNIQIYGADAQPLNAKPIFSQGQGIWRYHPEQRRYEVFAEGGGNAFGLEMDSKARIFSGHNGGNTRGFHYVQGGYLQKGFEKHGPLSNPYAFGYFPPMPHNQAERFTHNFIVYDGGSLPDFYLGKLFGVEPLQGRVVLAELQQESSTFRTRDLSFPVTTTDKWFRPVDIKVGPDGAVYVADWYDGQVNHYRNHEGQIDKENGRIYRIKARGAKPAPRFNLSALDNAALSRMLEHPNKWFRQTALRVLADRKPANLAATLREQARRQSGPLALEALWALNLVQPLDPETCAEFLDHPDPFVRAWTVRLLGDRPVPQFSAVTGSQLATLAHREANAEVRSQLASTAKRLPAASALPIIRGLLDHDEDAGDARLPLLIWWAMEAKADSDRDAVVEMMNETGLWAKPIVQQQILERLMRRYAAAGTRHDLLACAQLLRLAPSRELAARLMAGFELAFKGRPTSGLPEELVEAIAKAGGESLPLAVRRGQASAIAKALARIADSDAPIQERVELVRLFGETKETSCVQTLLHLIDPAAELTLAKAALSALQLYDDPVIGQKVAVSLASWPADLQTAGFGLLSSRSMWAKALLQAVDNGAIPKRSVPQDAVRRVKSFSDPDLAEWLSKHTLGELSPTTAEMQAKIVHLSRLVRDGSASPYEGQKVFTIACAVCHTLFGQGGKIGPDLTSYKRDDIDTMLLNVVNPSAEVREGYENYLVTTKDGRTLSGFLADKDNRVIVLRGLDGENNVVPQDQIAEMKAAGVSLMPEGLVDALSEQQLRDLFAYLRSTQPLVR